ncbi:hypothetical protein [Escherichia coli]|uniref:protein YciZ/DeoL n=1 Tax=Escherichia coli TaxID=562 RepID=UPI0032D9AC24
MSEFDAQRVAERIDIVLDILVAGDYHSAIHNLEILKAELLRQVLMNPLMIFIKIIKLR